MTREGGTEGPVKIPDTPETDASLAPEWRDSPGNRMGFLCYVHKRRPNDQKARVGRSALRHSRIFSGAAVQAFMTDVSIWRSSHLSKVWMTRSFWSRLMIRTP